MRQSNPTPHPTQEAIEDILRPYDLSGELTKRVLQAHLRAVKGELEKSRISIDSIVNAHLWGDYGLSKHEVYEGMCEYLDNLKERLAQIEEELK